MGTIIFEQYQQVTSNTACDGTYINKSLVILHAMVPISTSSKRNQEGGDGRSQISVVV